MCGTSPHNCGWRVDNITIVTGRAVSIVGGGAGSTAPLPAWSHTSHPEIMSKRATAASSTLPWYRQAPKVVAAAASTCAATVSVLSFLYSFGIVGKGATRNGVGSLGVAWVGLQPAADTATAIGDTLHLAATITDRSGAVVLNTNPAWSTEDPRVATVGTDGSVVARGPGTTTVTVAVGNLVARSRIVVHQTVASVEVVADRSGGSIIIPEAERRVLLARARDARGHVVEGRPAHWSAGDTTVLAIDSAGVVLAGAPGGTTVRTAIAGVEAQAPVRVVPAPHAVTLVAGGGQAAPAGSTLAEPVIVRVTSRRGVPIPGIPVRFGTAGDAGSTSPASAFTDAEGRARTSWTLGALPGRQALVASADHVDSTVSVSAEAEPNPATTRIVALSEDVRGTAGSRLAEPVAVTVSDTSGRLLPGVPVTWLALDGSVEPLSPRTDSLGTARAWWTLGRKAGAQHLQAQVTTSRGAAAMPPVTLDASALAGAAARVIVVSGDAQRGIAGAALRKPVVLRVLDSAGNGVMDAALALVVSAGSVADNVVRTDSAGMATIGWTLAQQAGRHRLEVRVAGVDSTVRVTALARAAAPANLALEEVPAKRSAPRAKQLLARVTDVYGNPVPNAVVRFSTAAGQVAPARAVSDAEGRVRVTWNRGTGPSVRRLNARVQNTDVQASITEEPAAGVKNRNGRG